MPVGHRVLEMGLPYLSQSVLVALPVSLMSERTPRLSHLPLLFGNAGVWPMYY